MNIAHIVAAAFLLGCGQEPVGAAQAAWDVTIEYAAASRGSRLSACLADVCTPQRDAGLDGRVYWGTSGSFARASLESGVPLAVTHGDGSVACAPTIVRFSGGDFSAGARVALCNGIAVRLALSASSF